MTVRAFLGLGSNLGDRFSALQNALNALGGLPGTHLLRTSGVYETEPFGIKDQPDFLNAVAEIETSLDAGDLYQQLKTIEQNAGRQNRGRWEAREIDIDILFYEREKIRTDILTIPHPGNASRRFVLVPLNELAPDFRDPESQLPVNELLRRCADPGRVIRIPEALMTGA